jgi:mono/diheme cytochrome c family protein
MRIALRWIARDWRAGGLTLLLLGVPAGLAAQQPLPEGVTLDRVGAGLQLFHGKGACAPCHGELGAGTADAPELIAGQWKLGPGTYQWLRHLTRHAGWGARSRGDDPQPMRGPTVLDSAEVDAVAAYVWSISRGRVVPAPGP